MRGAAHRRAASGNLAWIGHVQIADVPARHEPGTGGSTTANVAGGARPAPATTATWGSSTGPRQDRGLARLAAAGRPGHGGNGRSRARADDRLAPTADDVAVPSGRDARSERASGYFFEHDGFFLAAGLSFYVAICIVPFVLLVIAGSAVLISNDDGAAGGRSTAWGRCSPVYQAEMEAALRAVVDARGVSEPDRHAHPPLLRLSALRGDPPAWLRSACLSTRAAGSSTGSCSTSGMILFLSDRLSREHRRHRRLRVGPRVALLGGERFVHVGGSPLGRARADDPHRHRAVRGDLPVRAEPPHPLVGRAGGAGLRPRSSGRAPSRRFRWYIQRRQVVQRGVRVARRDDRAR